MIDLLAAYVMLVIIMDYLQAEAERLCNERGHIWQEHRRFLKCERCGHKAAKALHIRPERKD